MGVNCNLLSVLCTLMFPMLFLHLQIWGKGTSGCPVRIDAPKVKMAGDCASYKAYRIPQTWILSNVPGKSCMCKAECKRKRIPNQCKYWCKTCLLRFQNYKQFNGDKDKWRECHWFLRTNDIPGIAKTKAGTSMLAAGAVWNHSMGALFSFPHSNFHHLFKKNEPEVRWD